MDGFKVENVTVFLCEIHMIDGVSSLSEILYSR